MSEAYTQEEKQASDESLRRQREKAARMTVELAKSHSEHMRAWDRHHPIDPDESLFVAFDEGSVR